MNDYVVDRSTPKCDPNLIARCTALSLGPNMYASVTALWPIRVEIAIHL